MLLNLSNHPSSNWPQDQLKEANDRFNRIVDVPFPSIDPAWDIDKVQEIARKKLQECKTLFAEGNSEPKRSTIHVMGEMTFTFSFVKMAHQENIPCLASTTFRKVKEKGEEKVSVFHFVRFRAYE